MLRQVPNLLTLFNMSLGLRVVFSLWQGPASLWQACLLILLAAVVDGVDGLLARRLGAESDLGKQLDSFADLISFGVAPALITLSHSAVRALGWPSYAALCLYVLAAAYRLARFNLGDFKEYFLGLPITAAGAILTGLNLLFHLTALERGWALAGLNGLVLILAGMMASTLRIKRFC